MEYSVNCPICQMPLTLSNEHLDKKCQCPHCHEEICFSQGDLMRSGMRQARRRIDAEFKFIVVKFNEAEQVINSLYCSEGWYVISQSTIFLGETSAGWGGLGAATREEGLALILRRDI